MIKQKYDYSFFYDNYKYRCDSMFSKYYKQLEKDYRYFIIVKYDINKSGCYEVYRSNLHINDIIKRLKEMIFQVAAIQDMWAKFPDPVEYTYSKFRLDNGEYHEGITKTYRNKQSQTRRTWNDELIYMYYVDYSKSVMSARLDYKHIRIYYKGYTIKSKLNGNNITVHKSIPLSSGVYVEYGSEHKEMVEKVLNKVVKSNVRGFYDELILTIKNEFRIL